MSNLVQFNILNGNVDIGLEDAVQLDDGTYVVEKDDLHDVEDTLRELEEHEYVEVLEWDFDDNTFDGPPEQLRLEDDRIGLAYPDPVEGVDATEITVEELYKAECQRCGTLTEIELHEGNEFREPHKCANQECGRKGPFNSVSGPEDFNLKKDVATDPLWEPPTGLQEASMSGIWSEVRDYLRTYWKSRDRDYLYDGLTAYAISTWFRPALDFVPHLLIFGKHETGKTRLLNCLKNLSYHGVLTVDVTEAAMFRSINHYDVSFYISEYHDIRYEKRDAVDQVIKSGQKRGEIIPRAVPSENEDYRVEKFKPFTHMAIGSQFEPRDDIISRCIRIQTKSANEDVPFKPHDPTKLRQKLLYTRFNYLDSAKWKLAEKRVHEYLRSQGIHGRLAEKLYGLLLVAELADRDITEFVDEVVEQAEEADAESEDALVIQSIIYAAYDRITDSQDKLTDADPWQGLKIKYDEIADRYEKITGEEKSNTWLGNVVSRLEIEKERYEDGTYIDDPDLKPKLRKLAEENSVDWRATKEAYGIDSDSSQYDDARELLDIIRNTGDSEDHAPKEDILEKAVDNGFAENRARERLETMKRRAEIFETDDEVIRIT